MEMHQSTIDTLTHQTNTEIKHQQQMIQQLENENEEILKRMEKVIFSSYQFQQQNTELAIHHEKNLNDTTEQLIVMLLFILKQNETELNAKIHELKLSKEGMQKKEQEIIQLNVIPL